MYYLYIKLKPVHGFAARLQPQSKMRASFKYPPPTTFIGALSYPLTRMIAGRKELIDTGKIHISMANEIRDCLVAVAGHLHGPSITFGNYLRINRVYRGSVDYGVTALPITFLYSNIDTYLEVIFILKRISAEHIRAGWGITRIGSRESVFHTESVMWGKAKEIRAKSLNTSFSFWLNRGIRVEGDGHIIYCVDWRDTPIGDYSKSIRKPYFYPMGTVRVTSDDVLIGYRIRYDDQEKVVIC